MKAAEKIDVHCPSCHAVGAKLDFELTDHDQKLNCGKCSADFYWHVCPQCGTGWSDLHKVFLCPECSRT